MSQIFRSRLWAKSFDLCSTGTTSIFPTLRRNLVSTSKAGGRTREDDFTTPTWWTRSQTSWSVYILLLTMDRPISRTNCQVQCFVFFAINIKKCFSPELHFFVYPDRKRVWMMFRRSLKQRRPFQSADSGGCWRSSASAAGSCVIILKCHVLCEHLQ